MKLYQLADQINEAKSAAQDAKLAAEKAAQQQQNDKLQAEFEAAFADYLPMIKEAGISYRAFYRTFDSGCVEFTKNDHIAEMDFSSATSYRFYDEKRSFGQNCVYGEWDKDRIAVFLAQAFPLTDAATV